jgi:hypothetical protein
VSPVAVIRADPLLRELLLDVAEAAVNTAVRRDENLAVRIVNALGDSLKR